MTHSTLFFHQITEGMARMNHIMAAAKWHRLIILGLMLILFNLYIIASFLRFLVNIFYGQAGEFKVGLFFFFQRFGKKLNDFFIAQLFS